LLEPPIGAAIAAAPPRPVAVDVQQELWDLVAVGLDQPDLALQASVGARPRGRVAVEIRGEVALVIEQWSQRGESVSGNDATAEPRRVEPLDDQLRDQLLATRDQEDLGTLSHGYARFRCP
jgi:hypothetical protein